MENEKWQVDVNGEIFETDLETLKQWIGEYKVGPEAKVRKGNLNWLRAAAAPPLEPIFKSLPPPPLPPPPPVPETVDVQRHVAEHLVIPFASFQQSDNQAVQNAAKQLQDLINFHALKGWEFYRMDSVTLVVNPGCIAVLFGATPSYSRLDMVIFRRISVLTEKVATGRLIQPGQ